MNSITLLQGLYLVSIYNLLSLELSSLNGKCFDCERRKMLNSLSIAQSILTSEKKSVCCIPMKISEQCFKTLSRCLDQYEAGYNVHTRRQRDIE